MPSAKTRGSYHSPLRARQASSTRQAVLTAAIDLFSECGWTGTTLAAVAATAGTAIETVYPGYGSKSGLLNASIDEVLGSNDEVAWPGGSPSGELPSVSSRQERLVGTALHIATVHQRSAGLLEALRQAALSNAAAKTRQEKYEADWHALIVNALTSILDRTPPEHMVDAVWAIASPEVFTMLVAKRRWPPERYEQWLVDTAAVLIRNSER
jgi:AcrR family transcriptional regulator